MECRKILYTSFSLQEMFLHRQLNNLSSICHNGSFLCTNTTCTHSLCTNIVCSAASVFDAWVRRWLGRYWEHTDCLHAHGLPARIPTPRRAPHCGLTRQELHLQQDPQSGGQMLTYDCVNSFILKERKKTDSAPQSIYSDLKTKLDSCSLLVCDSSQTTSAKGAG